MKKEQLIREREGRGRKTGDSAGRKERYYLVKD